MENNTIPFGHKLGKMVVVTIVSFAATLLAEKAYDKAFSLNNSGNNE